VETVTLEHAADMQFAGQTHVLTVPIARTDFAREDLAATFERGVLRAVRRRAPRDARARDEPAHRRDRPPPPDRPRGLGGSTAPSGPVGTRRVWFENTWHDTPIYRRESLAAGTALDGPAIIEQLDTTTVIEPGDRARVDALGNSRSPSGASDDKERTMTTTRTSFVYVGLAGETAPGRPMKSGLYRLAAGDDRWESLTGGLPEAPAIRAIAAHPDHPETVFVGTQAGPYRSNDHGEHWERLDIADHGLPVWSLLFDPRDPACMYAGYENCEIYRSDDGGEHWRSSR
jgi:hypothetical protein